MSKLLQEVLEEIKEIKDTIEEERVFYALRMMKVKPVTKKIVDITSWCLAIESSGFRITIYLLAELMKLEPVAIRNRLHNLGDRGVLTLLRTDRKRHEWTISERFWRCLGWKKD